ncbi:MAG: family 16 glycosylhydrolase [Pseudomonadota bacterium]
MKLIIGAFVFAMCAGCGKGMIETTESTSEVVWAINVGGDAYRASDGIAYDSEVGVIGGRTGYLETIKCSQDPMLYQTYRVGDITVQQALPDGVYDVTLHFAEPDEVAGGERVFDVFINGQKRIADLDVMAWRDGKVVSALTVAAAAVVVDKGQLDLSFDAKAGEPILNAIVVRRAMPRDASWRLVWQDEFDYEGAPDPEKWTHDLWQPRKVNNEDQAYTDRLRNVRVENGLLTIEAHKESYNGGDYTSGRIHTAGKGDFLYGRFEIRAKLPRGQGTWPAIWMLPSDPYKYSTTCEPGEDWQGSETCDAWPNSGEIDILEHVGYQMGHVHGTVHNRAYYWVNWEQRKGRILDDTVDSSFHVYALEWSEDRIDIFLDDTLYFSYVNEGTGWKSWPYDHPFHLIINIAMGGVWGSAGGPTDDGVLPQQLLVDYVRVFKRMSE